MAERRKCRLLEVSENELIKIMSMYGSLLELPEDAEVAGVNYEPRTGSWLIRINSDEYSNINRYEDIPIIKPRERE